MWAVPTAGQYSLPMKRVAGRTSFGAEDAFAFEAGRFGEFGSSAGSSAPAGRCPLRIVIDLWRLALDAVKGGSVARERMMELYGR